MPASISVRDLHKRYGDIAAVYGVTFEVEQGDFFGILGPNGAGKTTTLETIEGLRQPDSRVATQSRTAAEDRRPATGVVVLRAAISVEQIRWRGRLVASQRHRPGESERSQRPAPKGQPPRNLSGSKDRTEQAALERRLGDRGGADKAATPDSWSYL